MEILIIVVGATLALSAGCSLLEATLYSTRIPTLEAARSGRHRAAAERFLRLKRDIASPTSAILILNTLANTAGATVAGWLAARTLGASMVPAFSVAFTLGILFISEILPKTFGATSWKTLWPWLAYPLEFLVRVLAPAVWVAGKFSSLFTSGSGGSGVTEAEIRASIRIGASTGELSSDELQMIDSVFHFDETTVREIMVPRDEVAYADLTASPTQFAEALRSTPFTRYPACEGGLDNVVGILHARDFAGLGVDESTDFLAMKREALIVPENLSITRVLRQMQKRRRQIGVVVDEYGGVSGIITLTDVLEEIVGSLSDELEPDAEALLAEQPDGSFLALGSTPLSRINREFGLGLADNNVVTLSGYVVTRLGRFPRRGDVVSLDGGTLEVEDVRGHRASRLRLRLLASAESSVEADTEADPDGSG